MPELSGYPVYPEKTAAFSSYIEIPVIFQQQCLDAPPPPAGKFGHRINKVFPGLVDEKFPGMEKSLSRLIKFLEILHDNRLIRWKGEKWKQ